MGEPSPDQRHTSASAGSGAVAAFKSSCRRSDNPIQGKGRRSSLSPAVAVRCNSWRTLLPPSSVILLVGVFALSASAEDGSSCVVTEPPSPPSPPGPPSPPSPPPPPDSLASPSVDLPLKIGVLGGSISWGAQLDNRIKERYSTLLALTLNATVINRAVPATGVSTPSLCLELILPKWRSLDVVVIEYNFNDAAVSTPIATEDGIAISALASLERLIRMLLSQHERPHPPLIIVLAVCEWSRSACETFYRNVTAYYRPTGCVVERSIHDGSTKSMRHVERPFFNHSMLGHWHPTKWGHAALGTLLTDTIRNLRPSWVSGTPLLGPPPRLPPPRWLAEGSGVGRGDASWKCLACSYTEGECPGLKPAEANGFMLHMLQELTGTGVEGRGKVKPGWRAVAAGSSLVVALGTAEAPRLVVLEALCSYENVGSASARLVTTGSRDVTRFYSNSTVATPVDFRWESNSSQHCLKVIGHAPSHNEVWLHLNVTSKEGGMRGKNQVKVFGVLLDIQPGTPS